MLVCGPAHEPLLRRGQVGRDGYPTALTPSSSDRREQSSAITVLIVDDNRLEQWGLQTVLEDSPVIHVACSVAGDADIMEGSQRLAIDVILMDMGIASADSNHTICRLAAASEEGAPRLLLMTSADLDPGVAAALISGAHGIVAKSSSPGMLRLAVEAVALGARFIGPDVDGVWDHPRSAAPRSRALTDGTLGHLTEREIDVLKQIAAGGSNREIAEALHIAQTTVRTHVAHLLSKLGLRDRLQAAAFAYETGIARTSLDERVEDRRP